MLTKIMLHNRFSVQQSIVYGVLLFSFSMLHGENLHYHLK